MVRRPVGQPAGGARQAGDGEAERVGDVRRPRQRRQPEQGLHAALHLALARGAVAGDRALDLRRRQREQGDVELARREVDDAAGVAHEDRGAREAVLGVEVLDHEERGPVGGDQAADRPKIAFSRASSGWPGAVRITPASTTATPPLPASMMPKPVSVSPGSTPEAGRAAGSPPVAAGRRAADQAAVMASRTSSGMS